MAADEEKAVKLVQDSTKQKGGQYEVGIPWKGDPKCLPDNCYMAVKKMMNTERKLEGYINKGYVKILEKDPESESNKWYLPQFAVIKQIQKQQRQELYLTLLQLKMVQV